MSADDLIAAIVAAPDDDAPRRVYADALLDADEPQGELIHLQCDLAAGGLTRDEAIARRRRERELLEAHGARWTSSLDGLATGPVFRRGFVDEVIVELDRFSSLGERLFAAAPALRGAMLKGDDVDGKDDEDAAENRVNRSWNRAIGCAAFRRMRGLGFSNIGYECRVFGEVTPGWESLGGKSLVALLATDPQLESLDAVNAMYTHDTLYGSPLMKRLTRLAICPDSLNDSQDLTRALTGSRIRSLVLWGNYGVQKDLLPSTVTELRIDALDLDLDAPVEHLERFAFATEAIRDNNVERAIVVARHVRELCLDGERVPGWRRLANAELPRLRVLRVHGDDIGAAEAEAILQMPCAAGLEVLYLKRIDDAARAKLEQQFGVVVDVIDADRRYVYWR